MKKIIKGILLSLSLVILAAGCKGPVFYEIMRDVAPEDATVSGFINSITRWKVGGVGKEKLVTYNSSGIITKVSPGEKHGEWQPLAFDEKGGNSFIIKTAADVSNLYAVTVSYVEDIENGVNTPNEFILWCNNGSAWNKVDAATEKLLYTKGKTDFNIFCTNDPNSDYRQAYLRSGTDLYKLSGTSALSAVTSGNVMTSDGIKTLSEASEDVKKAIKTAVYFKGAYIFFDSYAAITNATATVPATKVYWADKSTLCYSTDGTTKAKNAENTEDYNLNTGANISALAFTKNALLIGRGDYSNALYTKGGIAKVTVNENGVPAEVMGNFTTNATSQLASSYQIYTLLCANPEKDETDASIYATIGFKGSGSSTSVSYNNIGLWSYYKTRGNWNRE